MTLKYNVKSNEDLLIINPSNGLKKDDYSIIIKENNENNLRQLDEKPEIINNKLIPKNDGIIEIEIKFKRILNSMSNLFENCENLTYIDLSELKSERIKSMNSTFLNCHKLEYIKIKGNYKNLEIMDYAFKNSTSLININLSELELEKLKSMKSIFENCINLTKVDLSGLKLKNEVNMDNAFKNASIQILLMDNETKEICIKKGIYPNLKNCTVGSLCKTCENEDGLSKCTGCNEKYFLSSNFKYPTECTACGNNCKICENENKCNECIKGYELTNYSDRKECISYSSDSGSEEITTLISTTELIFTNIPTAEPITIIPTTEPIATIPTTENFITIPKTENFTTILASEPFTTILTTEPITTILTTEPITTILTTEPITTILTTEPITTYISKPNIEPNITNSLNSTISASNHNISNSTDYEFNSSNKASTRILDIK